MDGAICCLLVTKLFGPAIWFDESMYLKCKEIFTDIRTELSCLRAVATKAT
jgi:hypothetical protein